ncbi:hypothetical protein C2S51_002486 [Perilla frutescens var. frutescens]|nr:hypothetical protein C2S51_002486 [Perilla frutescens var. frutescens]
MNMDILEDFSASNDQMIVKGKRTKRLRPSSSASSSGGGGEFNCNSLVSSPTTSSGISTSTEEDEDLANCLILLARGGFDPQTESKFSSRKFTEMATTTAAKVGIYVYECKTCSRTFPSFQALGGHRASHKKPKPAADFDQKKSPPPPDNQEKEEEAKFSKLKTIAPPPPTPQLLSHVENKAKIHECSICGSEFASGQALGGHMRRHRSAPNSTPAAAGRSGNDSSSHDRHVVVEKTRNILELDLNLPAPGEDDRREAEFRAFSSNQQPRMVFSAAALVDCHY